MINYLFEFLLAFFAASFIVILPSGIIEAIKQNTDEHGKKRKVYTALFIACVALLLMWGYSGYESSLLEAEERGAEYGEEIGFERGYDECHKEMQSQIDSIENTLYTNVAEMQMYRDNVCFVTSTGECYHRYECFHLNWNNPIYIMITNDAINRGYRECLDCH